MKKYLLCSLMIIVITLPAVSKENVENQAEKNRTSNKKIEVEGRNPEKTGGESVKPEEDVPVSSRSVRVKGDFLLQAGAGYGLVNYHLQPAVPPVTMEFLYGITGSISLGGTFAYSAGRVNSELHHYLMVGIRGDWHFQGPFRVKGFDLYSGLTLGYTQVLREDSGPAATFLWNVHAGFRWYFWKHAGLFLEAGYGYRIVSGGFTFRFPLVKDAGKEE